MKMNISQKKHRLNKTFHLVILVLLFSMFYSYFSAYAKDFEGGFGTDKTKNANHGRFASPEILCQAAGCEEECDEFRRDAKTALKKFSLQYNAHQPDKMHWIEFDERSIGAMCHVDKKPPDYKKIAQVYQEKGGGHYQSFNSKCPCPGGIKVEQDSCSLVFKCSMGGTDTGEILKITTPCPTISVFTPQYPLVKMMSFALVEWNDNASVSNPGRVSYGAPNGISSPGAYYGAEFYDMNFNVTVSSVDIGSGEKFSVSKANAKKSAKSMLDRHNFEFALSGAASDYIDVLDQADIYEAYKNKSKYVQAYTVFTKAQNFGQRPWYTYEDLVQYMCKNLSKDPTRCYRELSANVHKDAEMKDNLYLGNGNTSLIGVYSEVSSHNCHGATVVDKQGNPAFAVTVKSKWCIEIAANYDLYQWQITEVQDIGECCEKWEEVLVDSEERCVSQGSMGECYTTKIYDIYEWKCTDWQHRYIIKEGWEHVGSGSSSGDCGVCAEATGYIGPDGPTTEPLAISFFQSQPLLVQP